MASTAAHRAVEAVWRIEAARLIAGLARLVHDVGRAEDLAQDALVAALEQWPVSGIPDRPGAWLMTVARRRAVDAIRRDVALAGRVELLGRELADADGPELPEPVEDDVLRLMFTACHPVLSPEAQAALTLRMLAGLTTDEIARAFLVPTTTMAQRIVRAKRALAQAGVGFEPPAADELAPRLASVLAVVYLVFNEGYSATAGEDLVRPALCEEAMRLGRVLAALVPDESEVHGLLALMELQASRLRARTGPDGAVVTLLDQDRGRWDRLLVHRGLAGLARAEQLGGGAEPYAVQAAIAAVHARAVTADATDWRRIAALYAVLARVAPSPVVELNRAVAVSMADARRPPSRWSTGWGRAWTATTCCRPSAATCWPGWAGRPRPGPSSSGPPGSRPTRASATCCSPGPAAAPEPVRAAQPTVARAGTGRNRRPTWWSMVAVADDDPAVAAAEAVAAALPHVVRRTIDAPGPRRRRGCRRAAGTGVPRRPGAGRPRACGHRGAQDRSAEDAPGRTGGPVALSR